MFAKGYISEYVRDIVGSTSVSGVDKAQRLLNTITDRVKTDPLAYNGFVDIIKKEGIWTSCYLDEFQKAYEEPSSEVLLGNCCSHAVVAEKLELPSSYFQVRQQHHGLTIYLYMELQSKYIMCTKF